MISYDKKSIYYPEYHISFFHCTYIMQQKRYAHV